MGKCLWVHFNRSFTDLEETFARTFPNLSEEFSGFEKRTTVTRLLLARQLLDVDRKH